MTTTIYNHTILKKEASASNQVNELRIHKLLEKEYKKYEASYYLLTKREIQVIGLMALGFESRVIAEKLFISKHTVDTHRKNILRKTALKTPWDIVLFTLLFDISI